MGRFENLSKNQVFPVEIFGNTAVISPAGDSPGFASAAITGEVAILRDFLAQPGIQHLILDLSRTNYFGSVMLGELIALTQATQQQGGRVAICGASNDMLEITRIMKIDSMWERFSNRAQALRAIATIPLTERLYRQRHWFVRTAIVVLIGLLYFIWPRPRVVEKLYEETVAIVLEGQALTEGSTTESQWESYLRKLRSRSEEIAHQVEPYSGGHDESARAVLYASRDYMLPAALSRFKPSERATVDLWNSLQCAEALLDRLPPTSVYDVAPSQFKSSAYGKIIETRRASMPAPAGKSAASGPQAPLGQGESAPGSHAIVGGNSTGSVTVPPPEHLNPSPQTGSIDPVTTGGEPVEGTGTRLPKRGEGGVLPGGAK
jgi:anti-anti-sigma regulatory factor